MDQHQAWEERERVLNMVVIIHLLLAVALWTRLAFPRVLEQLARPLHVLDLPLGARRVTAPVIASNWQWPPCAPPYIHRWFFLLITEK